MSEKWLSLQGDRQLWGQGDRKLFHFRHHWFRLTASPRVVKHQAPRRGLQHVLAPSRRHSLLMGANGKAAAIGVA